MVEAYLKSLKLPNVSVMSSGTIADKVREENEPNIPRLITILDKYGVGQLVKRHPEQLTQERAGEGDITICMNQIVADEAQAMVSLPSNTEVWDVDDEEEGQHVINPGENPFKYAEEIYEKVVGHVNKLKPRLESHYA